MANIMDTYESSVDHEVIGHDELILRSKLLDAIELQLAAVFHGNLTSAELAVDLIDTFAASPHLNYFSQERLLGIRPTIRIVK